MASYLFLAPISGSMISSSSSLKSSTLLARPRMFTFASAQMELGSQPMLAQTSQCHCSCRFHHQVYYLLLPSPRSPSLVANPNDLGGLFIGSWCCYFLSSLFSLVFSFYLQLKKAKPSKNVVCCSPFGPSVRHLSHIVPPWPRDAASIIMYAVDPIDPL